jgi:SulP family sulfate permease
MTLTLIDEMTDTRGRGNRECLGQGLANIITGFFGGMGGCAMIGQSVININSGGRGRLSGLSAGVFLLLMIMFMSPLLAMVPMAALTAVMFTVVIGTFAWPSLRILHKIPLSDAFVIVLVSAITVVSDLAMAVFVGVIVSALVFAWKKSKVISASITEVKGIKNYVIDGPLFFGSIANFNDIFTPSEDPDVIHVDFLNARVYDHSAIEAINKMAEKYEGLNKELHLKHLSKECSALIAKAGHVVDVNILEDPDYHVADDALA